MEIDPRHLAQLATIAECGSFSRAADALSLSQPALSSGMAQLERRLGVRVLERGRYGARLTSHGEVLIRHWRIVSSQLNQAAEEVKSNALGAEGPLAIGVAPVTAGLYVPDAIGELKRQVGAVTVTLVEDIHATTVARLRNGELDVAVGPVNIFPQAADLNEVTLLQDRLGLVIGADNPRYRSGDVTLHDIADVDWVLPSESSAFRRQLEALFITSNKPWPRIVTQANSLTSLKALVIQTSGVTIMPRSLVALECDSGLLRYVELCGLNTRREIGYTWLASRPLSPLAQQFVDILAKVCARVA